MTEKTVSTTIEILGKLYPVRCVESEVKSLQAAAEYLNQKMAEVRDSGKAINLERIAIITALNIAHEFLQANQQNTHYVDNINQRLTHLQHRMDNAINKHLQTEFVYSTEQN